MSWDAVPVPTYICGPLTDLPIGGEVDARRLYESLASVCSDVLGVRSHVPHEHTDPNVHTDIPIGGVRQLDARQIRASWLVVAVNLTGSWGGGIEVEMCAESKIPVIVLSQNFVRVSRLLRDTALESGGEVILFADRFDAFQQLRIALQRHGRRVQLMKHLAHKLDLVENALVSHGHQPGPWSFESHDPSVGEFPHVGTRCTRCRKRVVVSDEEKLLTSALNPCKSYCRAPAA